MKNDSGRVSIPTNASPAGLSADCYDCKMEMYLYMQICKDFRREATTFCIIQPKNAGQICNVPGLTETILGKLVSQMRETMLAILFEPKNGRKMFYLLPIFSGGRKRCGIEKSSGSRAK